MPSLSISFELLSSSGKFAKDGTQGIVVTLHRAHGDGHDQPCIFYWSGEQDGFESLGFLLLHHTSDGQLEKVHGVEYEGPRFETPTKPEISQWDHNIHQLSPEDRDPYY